MKYLFYTRSNRSLGECVRQVASYLAVAKPLSKVHVSNNGSHADYDPQDILLHHRMVKKIR